MKQPRQRSERGTVAMSSRNGRLRLRWKYQGVSAQIAIGPDTPHYRQTARAKASEIERDIALNLYDPTLAKYRSEERRVGKEC